MSYETRCYLKLKDNDCDFQLANVETMQQRDAFLSKHGDYLVSQGFTNAYRLTTDQLEEVKHALIKQYMYYR